MAYMNQERKTKLAPEIKSVLKKYGMKGTIGVRNHSALVVTIKSGKLDILQNWFETATKDGPTNTYGDVIQKPNYLQVNEYWINENYSGKVKDFLNELILAMKGNDWYDFSENQSDYFDTAYYLNINVGKWYKSYIFSEG